MFQRAVSSNIDMINRCQIYYLS